MRHALVAVMVIACTKSSPSGGDDSAGGVLTFSETELAWSLAAGEQATRTITITSETAESPIEVSSDAEWLTFANTSGTSPLNVVITVDTMPLDPGDYTVTLTARQGGDASKLTGNLVVSLPALRFSPTAIELALNQVPASGSVTVSATRGEPAIALAASEGWLALTSTSLSAPGTVEMTATRGGRERGEYPATITATADGYASAVLGVTMSVMEPPRALLLTLRDGSTFDMGQLAAGLGARIQNDVPIPVNVSCPTDEPPYDDCTISGLGEFIDTGLEGTNARCVDSFDRVLSTVCGEDTDCGAGETCEALILPPLHSPGGGSPACTLVWTSRTTPLQGTVSLGSGLAQLDPTTVLLDLYANACPPCVDPDGDGIGECYDGASDGAPCRPRAGNYSELDPTAWECLPRPSDRKTSSAFQVRLPAMSVDQTASDAVLTVQSDSPLREPLAPANGSSLCGVCTEDEHKPCLRDSDCTESCTTGNWVSADRGPSHSFCLAGGGINDVCQSVSAYQGVCTDRVRGYCTLNPLTNCSVDRDCRYGSVNFGSCAMEPTPCLPTVASGRVGSELHARNEIISSSEVYMGTPMCLATSGLANNSIVTTFGLPGAGRMQMHLGIEQVHDVVGPRLTFGNDDLISLTRTALQSGSATYATTLAATEGTATFSLVSDADWLTFTYSGNQTPNTFGNPKGITVVAKSTTLAAGTYVGRITATASGFVADTITVQFVVTP